jgi:hypothetical protein
MSLIQRLNKLELAVFHFFTLSFFCIFSNNGKAQEATSSPYSAYGVGDINNKSFGNSYAMGGTHIAMQNDSTPLFFINNGNPASYSTVRLTTVDLALNVNRTQLQTSTAQQSITTGSVGHVALAFPVKEWWGTSIGLTPYSTVGYKISDNEVINNVGSVDYLYTGTGGINQAYFGNGIKPLYWIPNVFLQSKRYERLKQEKKDSLINKILKRKKAFQALSLGANASYMFGNLNYTANSVFPSTGLNFNTSTGTTTRVSSFYFDYGLQYAYTVDSIKGRDLKENVKIIFGATMSAQSNLNAKVDSLSYNYFNNFNGTTVIKDTIINSTGSKGYITIPLSFGFGLGIKKGDRWLIATDYAIQNWSKYKEFNQSQGFKNSTRVSLGIQFIPNKEGSYLKRINYRMGGYFSQTMLVLNNNQITQQAATFGLGLPVGTYRLLQNFSMINIGIELGTRGTISDDLVKERYFKISLGFTMNDKWFVKPKYD